MKIAVIDLGTNTFNLLIRDTTDDSEYYKDKISVRLGQGGMGPGKEISPQAKERAFEALENFLAVIEKNQVQRTKAIATSGVRSAVNGPEFVEEIKAKYNLEVEVIDGNREAELIFQGVKHALALPAETALIMDIGGGSTEFILSKNEEFIWRQSFDIGSSRLMEKFRPTDPISAAEIEEIEKHLEEELSPLEEICLREQPRLLIGSSGSFDTLANMCVLHYDSTRYLEEDTEYTFDLYQYKMISRKMLESTYEQRLNTPGMITMRADMIIMACIQVDYVLRRLGINFMKLSTYALKEGVYFSLKEEMENG